MNKLKKYILTVIAISLFGEMYFYPFQGSFRFSAGVLVLSLVILLEDDLEEVKVGIYTGIFVLFLRSFIRHLAFSNNIIQIIKIVYPASIYYSLFGILASFIGVRKNKEDPILSIISLFSIDVFSNLIESVISGSLNYKLFNYILLIGFFRSIISYIIYTIFRNQEILIRNKEHQKRYNQLNTLVSSIQAEMFYLKKSTSDIENVMSKAMSLNEKLEDNYLKGASLDIAREVHEIKKDYYRVIKGFDNFLKGFENNDTMSIKDISCIIEDNINRFINESNKEIKVNFKVFHNIELKRYYSLFTILNNLIINSIEATEDTGSINLIQEVHDDNLILTLIDEGVGIDSEILPYIFRPGFTTKFDENTGNPSTGIGLSHIENIINDLKGTIEINSEKNKGTTFKITIPLNSLRR